MKINSIQELYEKITENEKIILDILRQIVIETIPSNCKEKLSYNVPYFYSKCGICIIWPASIPRGGFEKGVLFGFSHGNRLEDDDNYLTHGTNKQVYYKIYESPKEINENAIVKLLNEAVKIAQV